MADAADTGIANAGAARPGEAPSRTAPLSDAARRGAVPALRARPALQPDARGSQRRSPFWQVPQVVKAAVWQRDDHTCRFCGFRALRHQEVLVGGGNARDPDQMGTVCLFCHQCQHLQEAAAMRSGVLVWLPEVAQADLHWMARELYVARLTRRHGERARRLLDALLARRAPVRERLGSDHPLQLAQQLEAAEEGAAPPDPALLAGLRLLPLDRRILRYEDLEFNQFPQVLAYWRSAQGPLGELASGRADYAWLARLEQLFPPPVDAVRADAAGVPSPGAPAAEATTTTFAALSARLLRDAATFFRNVADQNPALAEQMSSNARVYEQIADQLEADPLQSLETTQGTRGVAEFAVRLLEDSADFFDSVGQSNAPLAEQMAENAQVYRDVAARLAQDPFGQLPLD